MFQTKSAKEKAAHLRESRARAIEGLRDQLKAAEALPEAGARYLALNDVEGKINSARYALSTSAERKLGGFGEK